MERNSIPRLFLYCFLIGAASGLFLFPAFGQAPVQTSTASASTAAAPGQFEALAAPIALYPDQLLAKVMVASTYPMEVVEAARWRAQNKGLSGAALDSALASQTWDDSVKDLTRVPEVLDMMDKQISWTQQLGDAVLSDQAGMLRAVQRLRTKAQANGTLSDSAQQKVVTENQTIIIQPAEPEKVYVPYYDSASIYGPWDYGYAPYAWPPPYGYGYGAGVGFVAGAVIGAAFWNNNCNWGGGNLMVNNFNNFNNINNIRGGQNWQHNVNHRRGANYGNAQLRDRYGRGTLSGANGRREFRGFDNAGLGGGIGDRNGLGNRGGIGDRGDLGNRGSLSDRGGLGNRGDLGSGSGLGSGGFGDNRGGISNTSFNRGFDGLGRGSQTRSFGSRGSSSLGSARASGFRGGGGGFRGGGGRRR